MYNEIGKHFPLISWNTDFSKAILTETRVGCPMKGTFGIVEELFKVFGPKNVSQGVSQGI